MKCKIFSRIKLKQHNDIFIQVSHNIIFCGMSRVCIDSSDLYIVLTLTEILSNGYLVAYLFKVVLISNV